METHSDLSKKIQQNTLKTQKKFENSLQIKIYFTNFGEICKQIIL